MKRVLIIIGILILIAGISFGVWKYYRNKRDENDRKHLNGMTRKEFLEAMRARWEPKYKSAINDWIRNNPTYMVTITDEADKAGRTVEEQINLQVAGHWNENPNPTTFDWAVTYWLPVEVDKLGIDYNDALVQQLIREI